MVQGSLVYGSVGRGSMRCRSLEFVGEDSVVTSDRGTN